MSKATITTRPINKMATKNTKIAPERGRSMAAITIARMTSYGSSLVATVFF